MRLHKQFLDPLGLTFPQYLVILELLHSSPRTVGELCTRLGMDTGTMTPAAQAAAGCGHGDPHARCDRRAPRVCRLD
nr:MarR family winged helix-turn-helix transcriptional regulator [Xanthomonas sp. BRIP62415]